MTQPDTDLTLTVRAAMALHQIGRDWARVLDPIRTTSVSSSSTGPRYATEDEADQDQPLDPRHDAARILAFWVHAADDEWPSILEHLEQRPVPTTDPAHSGWTPVVIPDSVDCSDVPAMARLLEREAARLATWQDGGHDYGQSFTEEVEHLAEACRRIAHPPKGDRITIGDCPACGRRVRVKAPEWWRVPHPTTDPETYPAWSAWRPKRDRDIECRCGITDTIDGWRHIMKAGVKPLTARQLVDAIHESFGVLYQPAVIRQWKRRGLIVACGTSPEGESVFDRAQVFAALIDREQRRDAS